jgi:hypothetical protein
MSILPELIQLIIIHSYILRNNKIKFIFNDNNKTLHKNNLLQLFVEDKIVINI